MSTVFLTPASRCACPLSQTGATDGINPPVRNTNRYADWMLTCTMDGSLDDIRFLADSQHRAVTMESLADGPRSRAELRDVTGASSATVGRIVQAFEKRGWLVRDGTHYSLTALGTFVAGSFAKHRHDMKLARKLDDLLPHVPIGEIGIDVDQLTDALVTQAIPANSFAMVSRIRELELDSMEARSLTDFFPEPCIDGRYEAIVNGTQTFEAVFAPTVIEAAVASDSASKFEAIVAADCTDIYVYDGDISYPVMFHDGEVCLIVRDEENVSIGMIETDDETVVDWVMDVFETCRAEATLLTPGDLTAPLEDDLAQT
ncbi:helix-turn-helix transcriptional regulator [Halalkalicoccus sp. GCM10025322]|uniref:helix-turn-helix transcriptional regulator n=1 Tax=Halalkalicoccus sp. GCM10025322 TaxID=3252661 RepID=UPI00360D6B6E